LAPAGVTASEPRLGYLGQGASGALVDAEGCMLPAGLDPKRPVIVLVHGFNPFPRLVRFDLLAAAGARGCMADPCGAQVVAWDWNADTRPTLSPPANTRNAVCHGVRLARALAEAGATPCLTHLVAHSLGCVVVAATAREWVAMTGEPVGRVTLLEPLAGQHALIFDHLGIAQSACFVEHRWSPGPSGYGRASGTPGVWDRRVVGPTPLWGVLSPAHSSHVYVLRAYLREFSGSGR
jgi:pimeloyl-ACP methyl ester carboxylesterase